MADIFVSYARADKVRVAPLVAALEAQGWSVWWDPEITPGQEFDSQISAALDAAKAVIVVWTPLSVDSRWVRGEAREAADRGVLVPVRFEAARLPIDARAMHTTDLDDWKGDADAQAFRDLCRAVTALAERGDRRAEPAAAAAAPATIEPTPAFWQRLGPAQMAIAAAVLVALGVGGYFLLAKPGEQATAQQGSRGGAETRSSAEAASGAIAPDQASSANSAAPREPLSSAAEGGVSLAVLPFADMSPEKDQEYFSDGLSEELLNQLAQIKDLRVAGRTSSFSFKGKNEDLRTIGEKLGVNHLLEGSVRKAGTRLRITAQLIKAEDGSHLWSKSYDRELKDVFAVQEEIAMAVTEALAVTLGVGDMARLSAAGTTNLEAYDKYLRAQAIVRGAVTPDDVNRGVELFREAIALDPEFAPARGALAGLYVGVLIFQPETTEQTLKEMNETVEEALTHAPGHWASHMANGVLQMQRHDWRAADAAFAQTLSLAPASDLSTMSYASLLFAAVGRNTDAVKALEKARSADPLSLSSSGVLQQNYFMAGRASEAEAEYQRTKNLAGNRETSEHLALMRIWDSPDKVAIKAQFRRFLDNQVLPMAVLNQVYVVFDQPPAALALLRDAFKDPAYQDPSRLMILAWYAGHYGDSELAIAALRRAFVDKQGIYVSAIWYPVLSEARKTPAFKQLVRDLGLYDYWRKSGKWSDHCHPLGTNDFECQ